MSGSDSSNEAAPQIIIFKARRYDVSKWIDHHPGGAVIERFIGQDVTCPLHMYHDVRSPRIQALLKGSGTPNMSSGSNAWPAGRPAVEVY